MSQNHTIITRFPPSPTGPLHIGNVRTALFNYLFARQNNGKFVVRVEDTDKARSKKEYEENMLNGLTWLGFSRDGELWHQSERTEIYKSYLQKLIESGKAYISQESEGENKEVVRFKNPNTTITFTDLIRGTVSFDTTELGDFIIARNINEPIYHLAVVIDDFETGVTHIIRGEDHVSNTPRQILIQEAIGAPRPVYAHLPLILAKDRSKLSKRKHGESVSLDYYRAKGYLPNALVNYMALLGWNPGTEQEIFTLDELIKLFDISKIQKGGAIFDEEKLKWIDSEHRKKLQDEEILNLISKNIIADQNLSNKYGAVFADKANSLKLLSVSGMRNYTFAEQKDVLESGYLDFSIKTPSYQKESLLWKDEKDFGNSLRHIQWVIEAISKIDSSSWNAEVIKSVIWEYATENGRGNVLWPMRMALSGKEKSPDPFVISEIIGKDETLTRLKEAEKLLQ